MSKVIFLKGLPGSGKSTWAKEYIKDKPDWFRTNKDEIRIEMGIVNWTKEQERSVEEREYEMVQNILWRGGNVIIDNTHFNSKFETRYRELASRYNAEFEIKFFDTPINVCLERNRHRPNPVPEKVILQMWRKHIKPSENYWDVPNNKLPSCIIVDIDGTLALFGSESPYDRDFSKDRLNEAIRDIIWGVKLAWNDYKIFIFSGRKGEFREVTEKWLFDNDVPYDALIMRPIGDKRPDVEVKQEMYETHIKGKYNVRFAIDDRLRVIDMWRNLGIFVFNVNQHLVDF